MKKYKSYIISCILVWLNISILAAQSFQHLDYLSVEDGLPSNYITSALTTEDGYLWITTKLGLNRYDGRKLVSIPVEINASDLASIEGMIEYPENVIWLIQPQNTIERNIYKIKEIFCYHTKERRIIPFQTLFPNLPFSVKELTMIYRPLQDGGVLLLVDNNQLFHLTPNFCKKIYEAPELFDIASATLDTQGNYWIIINNKIHRIQNGQIITTYEESFERARVFETVAEEGVYVEFFLKDRETLLNKYPEQESIKKEFFSLLDMEKAKLFVSPAADIIVSVDGLMIIKNKNNFIQSIPIGQFSQNGYYDLHKALYPNKDMLIFSGNNGIHFFNRQYLPFRKLQDPEQAISFRGIALLNDHTLIANSYAGQLTITRMSSKILVNENLENFAGYGMTRTRKNDFWSGSHGSKLILQDTFLNVVDSSYLRNKNGEKIKGFLPYYHEASGKLLIGSSKGILKYDDAVDSFIVVKKDAMPTYLLKPESLIFV